MSERQSFEAWWVKKHEADPNSKKWRVLADLDWEVWRASTARSARRPLVSADAERVPVAWLMTDVRTGYQRVTLDYGNHGMHDAITPLAATELELLANELRESHTINGEWRDEPGAEAEHRRLLRLASRLRKLHAKLRRLNTEKP